MGAKWRRRRRRSQTGGFWRQEFGGMPMWGLAGSALLIAIFGITAMFLLPQQVSAGDRQNPSSPASSTATSETSAPSAEPAKVAVLGDSFVVGTGSLTGSWVARVDEALDTKVVGFGQIGTGFVNPGEGVPYGERVADLVASEPDYFVVQATLNDTGWSSEEVTTAATSVLDAIAAQAPGTPLILVGPIWLWSEDQPDILRLREALAVLAAERGIPYIDPTGWITDETAPDLIGEDGIHPNDAGYAVLAERMAEVIRNSFGVS